MVTLSKAMYAAMGFREREAHETVSAVFDNVTVFELKGIDLNFTTPLQVSGSVNNTPYRAALCKSVNAAGQCLFNGDLVIDESKWAKELGCQPPYLLVAVGPTSEYQATGDYIDTRVESVISTYDSFRPAHDELRSMRERVHSSLLSSVACAFNVTGSGLSLREIWTLTFGTTSDDKTVFDNVILADGCIHTVSTTSEEVAARQLSHAVELAAKLDPKVHRVFYAALNERDPLKQFLFFFLAIERQTNASYRQVNERATLDALVRAPDRVKDNAEKLFARRVQDLANVRDRFIWCAINHWSHLDDADIDQFVYLKGIRDDIAHGHITAPPPEALPVVERLAIKLQLSA